MASSYRTHASHEHRMTTRRTPKQARRPEDRQSIPVPSIQPQLHPHTLTPAGILALQRTIGNQATGRLLRQSRALLQPGSAAASRPTTGPAPGPTIQRYYAGKGATNKGARISDNEHIILLDKKTLFASEGLIKEARAALAGVKSYVTVAAAGSTKKGKALQQVGLQWNAANVPARSHHKKVSDANPDGKFTCGFADCHRNSQMVMGSSSGGTSDTENPVITTKAGREVIPSTTRLEAKGKGLEGAHANRGVYAFFARAFPEFATLLKGRPETKEKYATLIADLEELKGKELGGETVSQSWTVYSKILEDTVTAELFAKTFGVNEFAKPKVGDALTQVNNETERKNAPADVDLWNFHWAGVIMTDGDDYITLENLSVENEDVINPDWYFQMYGTGKQSFHAEQKDPANAGSEHVGKTPLTLGFRDAADVSAAARGEYAAKGQLAQEEKKLPGVVREETEARRELAEAKAAVEKPEDTKLAADKALAVAKAKNAEADKKAEAVEAEVALLGEKVDAKAKSLLATARRLKDNAQVELDEAIRVQANPAANAEEKYHAAEEAALDQAVALARAVKLVDEAKAAVIAAANKTKAAILTAETKPGATGKAA
jgi:hypothetical protein